MILLSVVGFLGAALVAGLIGRWGRKHAARYGNAMPQRFHLGDIPRIGGAALLIGLGLGWGLGVWGAPPGGPRPLGLGPPGGGGGGGRIADGDGYELGAGDVAVLPG